MNDSWTPSQKAILMNRSRHLQQRIRESTGTRRNAYIRMYNEVEKKISRLNDGRGMYEGDMGRMHKMQEGMGRMRRMREGMDLMRKMQEAMGRMNKMQEDMGRMHRMYEGDAGRMHRMYEGDAGRMYERDMGTGGDRRPKPVPKGARSAQREYKKAWLAANPAAAALMEIRKQRINRDEDAEDAGRMYEGMGRMGRMYEGDASLAEEIELIARLESRMARETNTKRWKEIGKYLQAAKARAAVLRGR